MSSEQIKSANVNNPTSEKPYKRLLAWQRSMVLYSPIRSAALSAPSSIAEDAADQTRAQFGVFWGYAIRSSNEVGTQLEAARRVGLVSDPKATAVAALIGERLRLTYGSKRSL